MARKIPAASAAYSFGPMTFFYVIFAIILLPWLYYSSQQLTNSDILWLSEALRRVLGGATMTEAAYETNPPLSMLIYMLPVLAQSWLHFPLHYGVFIQNFTLIALSSYAVWAILRHWQVFSDRYIALVTAGYILINTYNVSIFIGERDHYIALGLVPFVLAQLSITYQFGLPRHFKWPVLILGTIGILIKPHHGLIPTLMLVHRLLKRRNFSVLKDSDFLALACGCILYAAIVGIFFLDYLTVILPDVITLYLPLGMWSRVAVGILTALICSAILSIGILYTPAHKNETRLNLFLVVCGIFSLLPYGVQGIGFYYQLIPALSFFGMAYAGELSGWAEIAFPRLNTSVSCLLFLSALSFLHAPLMTNYPTHQNHNDLNLPKLLFHECPKDRPCKFLMHNENMTLIYETVNYTGFQHASRFPALWFWPSLVKIPPLLSPEDYNRKYQKYSAMVAEDMEIQKPDVLVLIKEKNPKLSFIPFFSKNKKFANEIKQYRKVKTVTLNWGEYYRGLMPKTKFYTYDVYTRTSQ